MTAHTEPDTARLLDALVRLTDPAGRGPDRHTRKMFVNPRYWDSEKNRFDGAGFYSYSADGDHFLDLVDGRAYLTELGFRVLMHRQSMLDGPTPFNSELRVTTAGKVLVRAVERPDLLALWPAAALARLGVA